MSEVYKTSMLTEPVSANLIYGYETVDEKKKRDENYKMQLLNESSNKQFRSDVLEQLQCVTVISVRNSLTQEKCL